MSRISFWCRVGLHRWRYEWPPPIVVYASYTLDHDRFCVRAGCGYWEKWRGVLGDVQVTKGRLAPFAASERP